MVKRLSEKGKRLVKGKRYLFLSDVVNQDENKREKLNKIWRINKTLQKAYVLKEALRQKSRGMTD